MIKKTVNWYVLRSKTRTI